MPITVPVAGTMVSAELFGAPVANEVNRLTPLVDGRTPTPWVNVTYLNSYVTMDSMPVQYRKIGDIVYLRGRCGGGSITTEMFILPVGYRHPTGMAMPSASGDAGGIWGFCLFDVRTNGGVALTTGNNTRITVNFSYAVS